MGSGNSVPRLDALLMDWVTQGLAPPEEAELREILGASPEEDLSTFEAVQHFELAAAGLHLTSSAVQVPMPTAIEEKIREQAREHFTASRQDTVSREEDRPSGASVLTLPPAKESVEEARSGSFGRTLGWLAAAACLALAVVGWWPRLQGPGDPVALNPTPTPAPSLEERVAGASDTLRLPWTVTEDPAASASASGEVLWSTEMQAGFMRFAGLEANDPEVFQYQLWIFDEEQDERFPVDGGVFDLPPGGEALIPIQAKLNITGPTLFAVTVEKPGGVVVSSRERIVVLAQGG